MESLLPKQKTQDDLIKKVNHIILYGLPKSGKTTAAALIENNLILKFEKNATTSVASYSIDLSYQEANIETIKAILEKLAKIVEELKQDKQFKFVTIDTLSSLLPIAEYVGEVLYSQTLIGKNWFTTNKKEYGSILNLPRGIGYDFLKKGLNKIYEHLMTSGKIIITLAHVKDKYNENNVVTMSEIDAPGSISRNLAKDAQIIGYVFRGNPDEVYVSFENGNNILTGSTIPKLHGKKFLITKRNPETQEIKGYWEDMLPELFK